MHTTRILAFITIFLLVVGGVYLALRSTDSPEQEAPTEAPTVVSTVGYKDATYVIDGQHVALANGLSETEAAPGSISKIVTRYFGNEVHHDLNGDGLEDVVFLLTQESGGSGTFFYVVPAIRTPHGYQGGEAYFLGDRIAPQSTFMSQDPKHKDVVVVAYAERKPEEPMITPPSVGKSVLLKLDPTTLQFGIVSPDLGGEANPDLMSLTMKKWEWVRALYNDGKEVIPKKPGIFTLTFVQDGSWSATTDCNSMFGSYKTAQHTFEINTMGSTMMFCDGSQEADFAALLRNSSSYHFTERGELILDLKYDSGTVTFR